MIEISLEYWNSLANQLILISSLLSGYSIAVVANLLVYENNKRLSKYILKAAVVTEPTQLTVV
jgi:hypothetical protein